MAKKMSLVSIAVGLVVLLALVYFFRPQTFNFLKQGFVNKDEDDEEGFVNNEDDEEGFVDKEDDEEGFVNKEDDEEGFVNKEDDDE